MLIVPTDWQHRGKREFTRIYKQVLNFSFSGIITGLASILGIAGISVYSLMKADIHPTLYILVTLSLVYAVYFCRAYYKEKEKNKDVKNNLMRIHQIAHCLRILMIETNSPINNADARLCLQVFRTECRKISEYLKDILISWGYPVDHVCIKSYDQNRKDSELIVVERSDDNRKIIIDKGEAENDNPFFKLLFESHFNRSLIKDSELQRIKQNKRRKSPEIKYFAIGGLKAIKFPESLFKLLQEYSFNQEIKEIKERDKDELRTSMLLRADSKYDSLLGILITSGKLDFGFRPCSGFIGIDSKSSCAWDFIDENHLNLIAGIADLLYVPLLRFNSLPQNLLMAIY